MRTVYDTLGINVEDEESLRLLAHNTLSPPHGATAVRGGRTRVLDITGFLESVEQRLGTRSRRQVEYWALNIACTENHNPWTLYQHLFLNWASQFRRTGKDAIGLSVDAALIERRLQEMTAVTEQEGALQQQRHRTLSEWDFRLFSEHGLLELPFGSDYFPFIDALLLLLTRMASRTFSGGLCC